MTHARTLAVSGRAIHEDAVSRLLTALGWLILGLGIVWWVWQALPGPAPLDQWDWDQHRTYLELQRRSLLQYGQFPLWNPFLGGGFPAFAHPLGTALSPDFLWALVAGSDRGVVLGFLWHLGVALAGLYLNYRASGCHRLLVFGLAALVVLGLFTELVRLGALNNASVSYFPLIYYGFRRSVTEPRFLGLVVALLALQFFSGSIYPFVGTVLCLTLWSLGALAVPGQRRALPTLLGALGLTALVGAVKLFPLLELVSAFPRLTSLPPDARIFQPEALPAMWESIRCAIMGGSQLFIPIFREPLVHCQSVNLIFIGLVIWSLMRPAPWEGRILKGVFLVVFFVLWGSNSVLNLWAPLHELPVFASLRMPQRLGQPALFIGLLLIGPLWRDALDRARRRGIWLFVVVLALVFGYSVQHLASITGTMHAAPGTHLAWSHVEPAPETGPDAFVQMSGAMYPMRAYVRRGWGNLHPYDNLIRTHRTRVIPYGSPEYRGEAYFRAGRGEVLGREFTPNRLRFRVRVEQPDTLLINQNFFPGWRLWPGDVGEVVEVDGRIAVALRPGEHELTLVYSPTTFWLGLTTTLATLAAWGVILAGRKRALASPGA